jgi:hypothetical protein
MRISIYDKELNRVDIIESRFVSCLWAEGYNTTGSFSLELQESESHKRNVRPGYFVGRTDRKALMVITTVEARDGKIVATGKTADRLLQDVSFVGKIDAGSNVDRAVINAYNNSSKCVDLDFEETDLGVAYDEPIENLSILEMVQTMAQSKDVGFRVTKNGNRLLAGFYQPSNENPYRLAKGFGNVDVQSIVLSIENLKNYAIVLGTDSNDKTVRIDVDETNGDDRKEIIVDSGESPKDGETTSQFKERLKAIGHETLCENRKTWSANFSPIESQFGKKYDLGDFVLLMLPDYNLRFMARVTRFQEIEQNNSSNVTISVGEITIVRSKK